VKAPSQTFYREHLRAKRPIYQAHVTLQGVELLVEHFVSGTHLAATAIEDAERPTCEVRDVLHNGGSILKLLSEDQLNDIAEMVESQL
jgi:hypothetical protein